MSGMKFFKKFFCLFLALALCVLLAACGKDSDTLPDDDIRVESTEDNGGEEPNPLPDNNSTVAVLKNPVFTVAGKSSVKQNGEADFIDFSVLVEGETYQLPTTFAELSENGWELNESDRGEELEPDDYTYKHLEKDGETTIGVTFENRTDTTLPLNECEITGLEIEYEYSSTWRTVDAELPSGISLQSSLDDIKSAYGRPTYESIPETADDHFILYSYEFDSLDDWYRPTVNFSWNTEDERLVSIEFKNAGYLVD